MLKGRSIDEAAWLYLNGYPTLEDVEGVDSRSVDLNALAASAAKGDLVAMGLYGRALNSDGKFEEADRVLSLAVAKGSVFAVYELARLYGAADYQFRDVHESAAHVRAAYLLGDKYAGQRLYIAYPRFGALEFAVADQRGYEIYQGLLKLRRENGVGPWPRP
jgi:TPR repeat protein